jgi:hypothetical protein
VLRKFIQFSALVEKLRKNFLLHNNLTAHAREDGKKRAKKKIESDSMRTDDCAKKKSLNFFRDCVLAVVGFASFVENISRLDKNRTECHFTPV